MQLTLTALSPVNKNKMPPPLGVYYFPTLRYSASTVGTKCSRISALVYARSVVGLRAFQSGESDPRAFANADLNSGIFIYYN
jgi:hypothetical protein